MRRAITLFVVGCERSGTTLLRAMLDSHPELAIPPESYFAVPLLRHRGDLEHPDGIAVDPVVDLLAGNSSFDEWGLDADSLRAAWHDAPPSSIADALRDLYSRWAIAEGKAIVGDKTPFHVRTMDLLAESFPEARFVHLIRDGRDVAVSIVGAHFGSSSFATAVDHWERSVSRGRELGAAIGPGRYREIRYEDLVSDPSAVLRDVCDLIDLPFHESMLDYTARADRLLAPMHRVEHMQGIKAQVGSVGRDWRTHLEPRRVAYFEAAVRPLAAELGYELTTVRDGPRARTEVLWHRTRLAMLDRLRRKRKDLGRRAGWRPVQRAARAAREAG